MKKFIALLFLCLINPVFAQTVDPPTCSISGGTITCPNGSLTPTSTPGGSNTQVQYNNSGAFGGISGATTNGTTLTLVAPILGTPASGVATNLTGLPISTGLTGAGTGVLTALGNTAGGAGGFALVGTTPPTGSAGGSLSGTYPNPSLAAINSVATSFAIGGATIGTDALAVTGSATISGNVLSSASSGWQLSSGNTSGTAPSVVPRRSDTTSGLGASANGVLSLIASNVTRVQIGTGAASVSDMLLPGTLFTGGTGTTTFPQIFVQPTGTTAATTWSTSGTIFGANVVSGFAGNFIDFHTAGGASVFSVGSGGLLTIPNTGALIGGSTRITTDLGQFTVGASNDAILTRKAAASWQYGAADAAVAVAQTTRVQSVVAGTAAANGANWTLIGSLPTGTGTSGDIIFQTGVKTGSGTTQGTPTTALTIKGENAGVIIKGTNTNDDAASGFVGEIISSTIASGSAVSLTTATTANVTSITLTAGDWDVTGVFAALSNAGTNIAYISTSISTTSATNDATPGRLSLLSYQAAGVVPSGVNITIPLPTARITVASGTQIVYLTTNCSFSVSTLSGYGIIRARRIR